MVEGLIMGEREDFSPSVLQKWAYYYRKRLL
jgi:hypothetical protein